jgi:thioesterase domain-containing protein
MLLASDVNSAVSSDVQHSLMHALQRKLLSMPPVQALALRVEAYVDDALRLRAPLAPNVNDKGSAFGGSLASLLTLSAWGLATLKLEERGQRADVYVQDSQLRYLKPLYDDLRIEARLAPEQSWRSFVETFLARGKARATLVAEARDAAGAVVTAFEGRFVALRPAA